MNEMEIDTTQYEVLGDAQADETGLMLWPGFVPVGYNDRLHDAVESAITSKGGEKLVNVTVEDSWWWAWLIQGFRVDVNGTVIKKKV